MEKRKNLGVIGFDYLRKPGLVEMRHDVSVTSIAPDDNGLHEVADHRIPLRSLDAPEADVMAAVREAESRGICFDGFLSMRDGNVVTAAKLAAERGLPGPSVEAVSSLRSKHTARRTINLHLPLHLHVPVATCLLTQAQSDADVVSKMAEYVATYGSAVLKADRGSCKSFVAVLKSKEDIRNALTMFRAAANYRGGQFSLEQFIKGRELSVETIVSAEVDLVMITGYLPQREGSLSEAGHFAPHDLPEDVSNRVTATVAAAHRALGLTHIITHTEVFVLDDGQAAIVEVNPRIAGDLIPLLHQATTGVNIYRAAARIATGQEPLPGYRDAVPRSMAAAVAFAPPRDGRLSRQDDPSPWLKGPFDYVRPLFPVGSPVTGNTNDERPAMAWVEGDSLDDVRCRADHLARCYSCRPS